MRLVAGGEGAKSVRQDGEGKRARGGGGGE